VKKIPFTYWNHYDIYLEKPDIVIFLSPYDSTRPQDYHFASIQSQCSKTVYIQYALEITAGFIIDYFFRQPIHIGCWRIYVRSERYKALFEKYCPRGNDHVVVTGHPKMDLMYRLESHTVCKELVDKIAGRKVILWNPHHTLSEEGWGTFLVWYPVIMQIFKETPDIALVVRPHPLLLKNLRSLPEGNAALLEFMQFANESNNVILDTSEEYLDSFSLSDALISDESSLLLEYLPTRKPILFTPKAGRSLLNEDGEELVRHLYVGKTESDLRDYVAMIARHEDPMLEERVAQIDLLLYHVDGKAANRIIEDMLVSYYSKH
jgi:CDP-glycerol glycerophosphotransferase (TagB/SpsB family)